MMITTSELYSFIQRPSKGFRDLCGYTVHQEKPYLDEMMHDIKCIMHKNAAKYTDNTCYALRHDDLVSEQMCKLALIQASDTPVESLPNRSEAFRWLTTCLNNHVRGLVIRHRRTKKRSVQCETETDAFSERSKHCEVSLDNEESGIQLEDIAEAEHGGAERFIQNLAPYLTPLELLVLKELDCPDKRSLTYMILSRAVGREVGESIRKFKLKFEHHAKGLGMPLELFKQTVDSIGRKFKDMQVRDDSPNETQWNIAVSRLEEFFNVQIPRSMDKSIVRRTFTIAARDQYARVDSNQEIIADLKLVGAHIPQLRGGLLVCFGVLYQKNNRVCDACALKDRCSKEAANVGLGEITIHPRLLGNRQIRVPVIAAAIQTDDSFALPQHEAKVYNWIRDNFKFIDEVDGKLRFKRPGVAGTNATALAITVYKRPFKLYLHAVEDPALLESGFLTPVDNMHQVTTADATYEQLVALLSTHLEQHYAINDSESVI